MTTLAVLALSVALADGSAATGPTALRIAERASATAPARVTTLRCEPPGGTVRAPAEACRRLRAAGRSLFLPTPPGTACTQIYGGPREALVTGTVAGEPVWARFRRRDGCEIARWSRVAFLLAGDRASARG